MNKMNKINQEYMIKIQEYLEAINNLEIQHHIDFVGVSYLKIENMNEYQMTYENNDELEEQFESKETEKCNEFEKDGLEDGLEEESEDELEDEDEQKYFYYILFDKNLNKNFAFDYFTRKFYVSESK